VTKRAVGDPFEIGALAIGQTDLPMTALFDAPPAKKPLVGCILHDVGRLALFRNVLRRGVFVGARILWRFSFAALTLGRSVGGRHGRHMVCHCSLLIGCVV
jgi:hypothetical protein